MVRVNCGPLAGPIGPCEETKVGHRHLARVLPRHTERTTQPLTRSFFDRGEPYNYILNCTSLRGDSERFVREARARPFVQDPVISQVLKGAIEPTRQERRIMVGGG